MTASIRASLAVFLSGVFPSSPGDSANAGPSKPIDFLMFILAALLCLSDETYLFIERSRNFVKRCNRKTVRSRFDPSDNRLGHICFGGDFFLSHSFSLAQCLYLMGQLQSAHLFGERFAESVVFYPFRDNCIERSEFIFCARFFHLIRCAFEESATDAFVDFFYSFDDPFGCFCTLFPECIYDVSRSPFYEEYDPILPYHYFFYLSLEGLYDEALRTVFLK